MNIIKTQQQFVKLRALVQVRRLTFFTILKYRMDLFRNTEKFLKLFTSLQIWCLQLFAILVFFTTCDELKFRFGKYNVRLDVLCYIVIRLPITLLICMWHIIPSRLRIVLTVCLHIIQILIVVIIFDR
jgi:hypothetical protein